MKLLVTFAAAVGIFGLASAAQAMPMAPTETPSAIITVAGGCGPGWHPNPWGRCVPFRYRRAPVYRYGYYAPPRVYYGGPRYYGGHRWHRSHWRRW